ncbi:MAG: hypothetical protein P8170_05415 [Gemmatimonadota bacterium]
MRVVRVARDGRLWIREPGVTLDGLRTWTVVTSAGVPEALAAIPARFDPQEISPGSVMGRWLGQDDVNFVRTYALAAAGTSAQFMARVREAIMRLASAQEIYYAGHATSSASADSLSWDKPEDIGVDIVTADARGWAGVFAHPGLDRLCGLGYGAAVPPGWPNGSIVCGPAAATKPQED